MSKILYRIKNRVWLTQTNNGVPNVNMPYGGFNADFVLYKGTDAVMEFYIKNLDRKPIPSQGKEYKVYIMNFETGELVLCRKAKVEDPYRGLIKLDICPADMNLWETGYYRYSVLIINEDGTENPLYMDQDHDACGYLELKDCNLPRPAPTRTILPSDFLPINNVGNASSTTCYLTQSFPGSSNYSFYNKLTTLAFYMTDFEGSIRVQASLDEVPEQDGANWFDIDLVGDGTTTVNYPNCSGIDVFSVQGNFNWLRIEYCPSPSNTGTIDQVLVKV